MEVRINHNNENLWCNYSKLRIHIGEKYVIVEENYRDAVIQKSYKLEYCPVQEELEDDTYIISDDENE